METAKAKKSSFDLIKAAFEPTMIVIGFVLIFGFQFIPPFPGLNEAAMHVMGIFLGGMVFWLFISITWPSLIVLIAMMTTPLYTYSQVIQMSMGVWVVTFVMFSTALCHVLTRVGIFKRCAIWILTRKIVTRGPWYFISILAISTVIIGSFVSQLTVFLIFVPITLAIFEELGYKKGDRVPALITVVLLLVTTYSNFTTPISHVMPIIGMSLYTRFTGGLTIGFLEYILVGVPICTILMVIMLSFIRLTFKADFVKIQNINTDFLLKDHAPMSKKEKICAVVFMGVVFLWIAPGVFSGILPGFAAFVNSLGAPTPPMIGVIILCIIKIDGEPIVEIEELLSNGVRWGVFLIIGATAVLGDAITHPDVGITTWIGEHVAPLLNQLPPIVSVLLLCTVAVIMTNFASDAVTVTLLTSIAVPMILSGELIGLNAAALTYVIGQTSTIGPATAIGGASSAIASGDGWLDPVTMFTWGMLLSLMSGVLMAFLGYPLATLIMS
jgi:sodium-dependent dicarboxylate transporter 2/3/5